MEIKPSPSQQKTKILVIDDERLIRLTLKAKLKLIGYTAVCVGTVQEAVALLNDGGYKQFTAIISDIMMDGMDGFVFRDIIRGMDASMPIFFMTALDPEEGSGFLRRIMEDNFSFYLPKSVKADMLLNRVQAIVTSRRSEEFIREQTREVSEALKLASHVQRSMLPPWMEMTDTSFYVTWWLPKESVSGDLFEVIPLEDGGNLYILGDIQGHGASAALSMMAAQSFLKQLRYNNTLSKAGPADVANMLQHFFITNLGGFSYMTALICAHHPKEGTVDWISCGAPDLRIIDPARPAAPILINPENRGGLPIGMMDGTEYTDDDVVHTLIPPGAMCVAVTDGIYDIYRDQECFEQIPEELRDRLQCELLCDARMNGSIVTAPAKFISASEALGYNHLTDDITELVFGAPMGAPDLLKLSVPISADIIDQTAQRIDQWCSKQGWDPACITKIQLVFEEKLMNLHDHGFDVRDRARERAWIRLRRNGDLAELTVWDCGTPEPSINVALGNLDVAMELKNREFSGRGRGRMMVREICCGIQRNRYGILNETVYMFEMNDNANKEEN